LNSRHAAAVCGSSKLEEPGCGSALVGRGAGGNGCVGAVNGSSLGGVRRWFGVVEREDSREEVPGDLYPDRWRRFWAASSAASFNDMADGFLRAVLKVKRARDANVARVSLNFSCNAFIACSYITH
jgi:hypothetical protein